MKARRHRFAAALKRDRRVLIIVALFVVLVGGMVGYNARITDGERSTPLVVDVTARQRTLVERYVKDVVLRLDGVQADPSGSATILRETADALLRGGEVVTPQGSLDQRVSIPAAKSDAVRVKLSHERTLIHELLTRGDALLAAGKSSPTFSRDLQQLRVVGAELSSVTGDAAGEITTESQNSLSRLVFVEIALGAASVLLALAMGLMLRKSGQRQSARFRSLVHNSSDLITVLDRKGEIGYQSPSSTRVLGVDPSELVDTKLVDLVHPEERASFHEMLAAVIDRTGSTSELHFRLRRHDGEWRVMEGTATNLLNDRNVRGVVVNSRDVTDRELAAAELASARDRALGASKTKSQFLASMSHEIRTPMNAIIGLNSLLLDSPLDAEQQEFARGVQTAAEGLLGIINDILDFSKVEAGKLQIETIDFDLAVLVEDVATMLADVAHAKSIELLAHVLSDVPSKVRGDPTRVRQILLNLASNAVKFTSNGEVLIRARKVDDNSSDVRVRFEVLDTGVGIKSEDVERVFEAFSQADSSTTRRFGGSGLGLAIVKQLVELMHGTVGAESALGVGSTFWFELPFAKQDGVAAEPVRIDELTDQVTLIVDDNATNRLILREQLASWGMACAEADHAAPALELLRQAAAAGTPYGIVLLDLNMPDIDGMELARTIRDDPALNGARMFLLSSSGRIPQSEAAASGLTAALVKPVRPSELFNCLVGGLTMIEPVRPNTPAAQPSPTQRRGHLLLVEDNPTNQLVATRMLAKLGYEVDVAANGLEGVDASAAVAYDAILMDCQMPEMDGYQATAAIRRREGDAHHTPIIAMTAAAMEGDREVCIAAGMDDYISKPVRTEQLASTLERWVQPVDEPGDGAADAPGPALDPERFELVRELDDGDGVVLHDLVSAFLDDTSVQLERLAAATAEGDPEVMERIAHSVKGASGSIGAIRLADRCAELEVLSKAGLVADARAVADGLDAEFVAVRESLTAAVEVA